jgi:hypothetical protein
MSIPSTQPIELLAVIYFAYVGDLAAVQAYRPHARPRPENSEILTMVLLGDEIRREHLAVIDELLDGYPGIDPAVQGPIALKSAARAGHLGVLVHLFPRFGESTGTWLADDWRGLPVASSGLLQAMVAGRVDSGTPAGSLS